MRTKDTYKIEKLGSLGCFSDGWLKTSEMEKMTPLPPLYRDEKGAVIFPPEDPEKPHPLDLHCIIENGGHNATYYIYCSVVDTEASGTCMGQVKRHSHVGMLSTCANLPMSYQNSTL